MYAPSAAKEETTKAIRPIGDSGITNSLTSKVCCLTIPLPKSATTVHLPTSSGVNVSAACPVSDNGTNSVATGSPLGLFQVKLTCVTAGSVVLDTALAS